MGKMRNDPRKLRMKGKEAKIFFKYQPVSEYCFQKGHVGNQKWKQGRPLYLKKIEGRFFGCFFFLCFGFLLFCCCFFVFVFFLLFFFLFFFFLVKGEEERGKLAHTLGTTLCPNHSHFLRTFQERIFRLFPPKT